ncbi:RNA polymerase sigma factor [Streptomyces sp. NPDC004134]|uniref:RNA polymerase sigma factor n=1 Tax=Streptomyces sp. NPDC004134 TaxID=3364691 RepID=UPI00369FCD4A
MRRHDEESFREFAAAQARPLRRTAFLLCGDWHLAEDLMQNSMIKMYRSWHRLERHAELGPYARRVLLRTWLDERRKPWRRSEQSLPTLPDTPDVTAGPEAVAEHTAMRHVVRGAVLALPPRQRAVVVLRYFDDLSVAQTAGVLGCSEGNVKSQAARGLRTLRGRLAEEGVPAAGKWCGA